VLSAVERADASEDTAAIRAVSSSEIAVALAASAARAVLASASMLACKVVSAVPRADAYAAIAASLAVASASTFDCTPSTLVFTDAPICERMLDIVCYIFWVNILGLFERG